MDEKLDDCRKNMNTSFDDFEKQTEKTFFNFDASIKKIFAEERERNQRDHKELLSWIVGSQIILCISIVVIIILSMK